MKLAEVDRERRGIEKWIHFFLYSDRFHGCGGVKKGDRED